MYVDDLFEIIIFYFSRKQLLNEWNTLLIQSIGTIGGYIKDQFLYKKISIVKRIA